MIGEERVAFADDSLDVFAEIHSEGNVFHILKHIAFAEVIDEAIVNAAGHIGAVAPPVRDEDAALGFWRGTQAVEVAQVRALLEAAAASKASVLLGFRPTAAPGFS